MKKHYTYDPKSLPRVIYDEHPDWVEIHDMAWKTAFDNIEYPDTEGWLPQMSCMPASGNIWQWDSCFMTLFARYSNGALPSMNNLDNIYRLQRNDGYISMAYIIETGKEAYGERINPPLFAWVEWEYFLVTGDDSRFSKILPILIKYYEWVKQNRRRVSGLYWFEDTGSTGMDNSPRSGYNALNLKGSDVCFIDLSSQQALSAMYLAKIAEHAGDHENRDRFLSEFKLLKDLVNSYHWSEKHGFYFDLFSRSMADKRHNFINIKTAASFWPILANIADDSQSGRLNEHLMNPDEFYTPHPVATLSKDDPNYDPFGGYWLGSVWPPTNYMVTSGLKKRGMHMIARDIAIKHLDAMCAVMRDKNYGGIWECYAPEFMRPATTKKQDIVRSNFVGWSGLGPIAMLIENIIGLSFDAESNTISWEITAQEKHGVENLVFNGKTVSLICAKCASHTERKIMADTSDEVKLNVSITGRSRCGTYTLSKGKSEIVL